MDQNQIQKPQFFCTKSGHEKYPVQLLCLEQNCKKSSSRLICLKCCLEERQDHFNPHFKNIIDLQELDEQDKVIIKNLPNVDFKEEIIKGVAKQEINLIDKIETLFEDLIQEIMKELEQVKQQMKQRFSEQVANEDNFIKDLKKKIKDTFNIDHLRRLVGDFANEKLNYQNFDEKINQYEETKKPKVKELEEYYEAGKELGSKFTFDQKVFTVYSQKTIENIKLIANSIKEKIGFQFIQSKILENSEQQQLLRNWIQKEATQFNLLYRASENQFAASSFHEKCDNKGATLTILKSEHAKIFGGFTKLSWSSNPQSLPDVKKESFIFSITEKKQFFVKNDSTSAILCQSEYGPVFGGGADFRIYDKCDQNTDSYSHFGCSYDCRSANVTYQQENAKKYLAGSEYFKVIDYEVYQIIF